MDDVALLSLFGVLSTRQKEFIHGHLNIQKDSEVPMKTASRQAVSQWKAGNPDFRAVYNELKARLWRWPQLEGAGSAEALPETFHTMSELAKRNRPDEVVQFDDKAVQLAEQELKALGDNQLTIGQQVDTLTQFLPKVVRRHLAIIMDSTTSNKDALVAIRLFYETMGITADALVPGGRAGKTIINVLQMVTPQVMSVAKARGLTLPPGVQEIVEGQVKVQDAGDSIAVLPQRCANNVIHMQPEVANDESNDNPEKHQTEEFDGEVPPVLDLPSEGCNIVGETHGSESFSDDHKLD